MGLMRQMGLIVHHLFAWPTGKRRRVVHHQQRVEQEQVSPGITLRRTTIEEIEVHPPPHPPQDQSASPAEDGADTPRP
jgi:hypothetical protein